MGGKGKKTKWKKLPLGDVPRDDDKATNHRYSQNGVTDAQLNSALSDVSSTEGNNSETSIPEEISPGGPDEQAQLAGCYMNGLWMPLDYEKAVACHPFYAPYTVLPSTFCSYSTPLAAPLVNHFPCCDYVKPNQSSPYCSSSYLTPTEDPSEDNIVFVPYLYPGYTFGPPVYGTPTGGLIGQGGRKRRKRPFKSPYQERRQLQPGIDVISTPSCDVIRYSIPSASEKNKNPNTNMTEERCLKSADVSANVPENSTGVANLSDGEVMKTTNELTEKEEIKCVSSADRNGASLETSDREKNHTMSSSGVRTVSRFKVYPCPDDPLRVQETNRQPSPSPHHYFTNSETLLRETELELNRLNKKAFQANQSIYQLAFGESIDEDNVSNKTEVTADPTETKITPSKKDDLPEELRELPGSRMEIEVHEMDSGSEAGSEDVEILPHRYDSHAPTEKHVYVNRLSLATELLRTRESLPYDSEFKRLVDDDDLSCVELDRRINSLDSGVQSEDSGDEVVEEPKSLITQKEEIWCTTTGQHYRRAPPTRIPYLSPASSGPFPPCLCCIIM